MPEADDIASKTPTYNSLPDQWRAFVDYYTGLRGNGRTRFNDVQSYIAAGYVPSSAQSNAWRMREYEGIREAIREVLNLYAMTDPEAAAVIANQARGSLAPFLSIDERTGLVEVDLKTEEAQRHLSTLKKIKQRKRITRRTGEDGKPVTTATVEHEIEIHDAQAAAHKIRQAHGAYGPTGRADDPLHAEIRFVVEDRRSGVEERKRQHERLLTNGTAG